MVSYVVQVFNPFTPIPLDIQKIIKRAHDLKESIPIVPIQAMVDQLGDMRLFKEQSSETLLDFYVFDANQCDVTIDQTSGRLDGYPVSGFDG